MINSKNKRDVGGRYEELAAQYLMKKGYNILERNYRNRFGEIDIIAKDGNTIVYVEVKYRKNNYSGEPIEAVGIYKQRKISKTAFFHYSVYGYSANMPARFDVIGIDGNNKITHIINAFEYVE